MADSNILLIAVTSLVVLVIGFLFYKRFRDKRERASEKATIIATKQADFVESFSRDANDNNKKDSTKITVPEDRWGAAGETFVSVESVDHYTEYKIYKQFCYFQKAADSLHKYLQTESMDREQRISLVLELGTLLAEGGRLDDLADVTSEYSSILGQSNVEILIRAGLEKDPSHLALRVIAEEVMGWDVQKASKEIGVVEEETLLKGQLAETPAVDKVRKRLVHGDNGNWQVSQGERDVVIAFEKPDRSFQLLKPVLGYEDSIRCLDKAIQQKDKPASLIIDALTLDYKNNKLGTFVQHLWRLYYSLGRNGKKIKDRMLGWGYNLGHHPVLDELGANPSEQKLRDIGVSRGYLQRGGSSVKATRQPLVKSVSDNVVSSDSVSEKILYEVESLLNYGQLDEAMEVLENGIWKHPNESQLYIALFDLYERSEDWQRLESTLQKIREQIDAPPEEVVLAISRMEFKRDGSI